MAMQTNDITARVRLALDQGDTAYSLALKAGLHRNTLYGWNSEGWNPTLDTLRKLEPHLPAVVGKSERAA